MVCLTSAWRLQTRPALHATPKATPCLKPNLCALRVTKRSNSLQNVRATVEADDELEDETFVEGDYCMPGDVTVDNSASADYTVLTVQVKDYPGLFRVLAWVINGLDLVVEQAEIDINTDGYAVNTFWLKNRRRQKLPQAAADLLSERVTDYVRYCTPDTSTLNAARFANDMVQVDNEADAQYTVALICPPKAEEAALLNVATTLTGIGLTIHKASIAKQAGSDPIPQQTYKFWLSNVAGQKLDYGDITSMMYTLKLVWTKHNIFSTTPPFTAASVV